jgi:tyrosine-protein kinase Etk/Wzc
LPSLLEKIRPSYRYVIIDTPPVLAASEALVFAKAADASLICTMRDASRMEQVNMAYERLTAAQGNPIGVVLNGVPSREYAYRYGRYWSKRDGEERIVR